MALIKEKINYPFAQGIDTKTDDKQLSFEKLAVLENGRFNKVGKIEKRFGTEPISIDIYGGGTLSNITKIFNREDELLCIADNKLYSYSEVLDEWKYINNLPYFKAEADTFFKRNCIESSVGYIGNYELIVGFQTEDAFLPDLEYYVRDKNTKTIITSGEDSSLSGATNIQIVCSSDTFFIFYKTGNTVAYKKIPISTFVLSSATNLITDVSGAASFTKFDISQSENIIYISYICTGLEIKVYKLNLSTEVSSNYLVDSDSGSIYGGASHISSCLDSNNNLYIAYSDNFDERFFGLVILDEDLAEVVAPTTSDLGTGAISLRNMSNAVLGNQCYIFYTQDAISVSPDDNWTTNTNFLVAEVDSPITTISYLQTTSNDTLSAVVAGQGGLTHKVFSLDNSILIPLIYYNKSKSADLVTTNTDVGNSFFYIQQIQAASVINEALNYSRQPIVKCLEFQAYNSDTKKGLQSYSLDGDIYIFPLLKNIDSSIIRAAITLIRVERTSLFAINFENKILFSSSIVKEYDGQYSPESNFLKSPDIKAVSSTVNGSGFPIGNYSIRAMYLTYDNFGNEIRSEISQVRTISLAAARSLTIQVEGNGILNYQESTISNKLFKLVLFISNASTDYYYTTQMSVHNTQTVNNLLPGTTGVKTGISYYTNGGELGNYSPILVNFFTKTKNRIFYVSTIDKNTVYYSKLIGETNVIEFNPNLYFDVIGGSGYITGIASMDDKLIIFKENDIFVVGGDGPDNTGSNNTFSEPASISTDVGCINQDSIVLTNNGLMFQSNKGIYLLNRSLQVEFIGAPVDDYKNETIKAAHLLDNYNEVRFLTENRCLVYNYYVDQWAVFTYSGVHAHIYDNTYYFTDGDNIFKENESIFTDDSEHYALKITTPWLALNNIHNLQRIYYAYLLGDYKSAHSLKITTYYDYDLTDSDTTTIVSSDDYTTSSVYQMQIFFKKQKCEAIKISIEDVQTESIGEGLSLSNLQITYGRKKGNKSVNSYKTE